MDQEVHAVKGKKESMKMKQGTLSIMMMMEQDGQPINMEESLKKFHCIICNKRFAHISGVNQRVNESKCETCGTQFTPKTYLNHYLKYLKGI